MLIMLLSVNTDTHLVMVTALYVGQGGANGGDLLQRLLQLQVGLWALHQHHTPSVGLLLLHQHLTRGKEIQLHLCDILNTSS